MARKDAGHRDASGTSAGADLEPLRGGMKEIERDELGPDPARRAESDRGRARDEHAGLDRAPEREPAAPYHGTTVPEGGLAPRAEPREGSTPRPTRGEIDATAGEQLARERSDHENEAANAHRDQAGARGDASPRRDPEPRDPDR